MARHETAPFLLGLLAACTGVVVEPNRTPDLVRLRMSTDDSVRFWA